MSPSVALLTPRRLPPALQIQHQLRVQIVKVENEGWYGGNIGGAGRMRKGYRRGPQ
jgi:hypothetical protein